jgi:DNA processing protein
MARGIDAVAHQGALEAKGKTVAFLGSGLDVIYPPEHTDLYRKISETGAVLSEFPLGRKADRRTFPMRNRLVSGISSGVIVVESASSGGSLITAKLAADQGRMVLAVPGRVDQVSASGCNQLIRDGATLVRNADDVMEEIEPSLSAIERQVKPLGEQLEHSPEHGSDASISEEESKLIKAFEEGDYLSMEELGEITSLEASKLSSNLTMLELNGLICKRSDGRFEAL